VNSQRFDIFPTPIMVFHNLGVLDEVQSFIDTLDPQKRVRNFHTDDTVLITFKKMIFECVTEYFKPYYEFSSVNIKACWVTSNNFLEGMGTHNHMSCVVNGIYYINSAPLCGDLILLDPRGGTTWPETKEYNNLNITTSDKRLESGGKRMYRISPEPDKFVVFPAYMMHTVEINLNPTFRRRSIGLNFEFIR